MTAGLVGQSPITTFTSPVNGTLINADVVRGNDNTTKTAYNVHDSDPTIHFQSSLNAARPAAGTLGRKWLDTDTYRVYYDDGAAWHEIAYLGSGGGTVTGNVAITGTLDVAGNFSVATNKFTVAAASGNTVVAGTLGVAGLLTASAGISSANNITATGFTANSAGLTITGGDIVVNTNKFTVAFASGNTVIAGTLAVAGAMTVVGVTATGNLSTSQRVIFTANAGASGVGSIYASAGQGLVLYGTPGSSHDFAIIGATSNNVMTVATGTENVTFGGTVRATRVIGGTDISGAAGNKIAVSDGTAITSAYNPAQLVGIRSQFVSADATAATNPIGISSYLEQNVGTTGDPEAIVGYLCLSHTSGTVANAFAVDGFMEVRGSGGTATRVAPILAKGIVSNGTVTIWNSIWVSKGTVSGGGAIGTSVGVEIDSITGATKNYAIRTQASCSLFNGSGSALATNATVGFVHLPNMAGTPTGVPANLVTGASPCCIDTTAGKFWSYYGGAWHFVTMT